MALSFPLALPLTYYSRTRLYLSSSVSSVGLWGGKTQSRQFTDRRWIGEWLTPPQDEDQLRATLAWGDSLRDGVKEFYAWHPRFPYPKAYVDGFTGMTKAGGGSFTGAGDVDSLTSTTITISGLPASFVLSAGDLVGLIESAARGLHRIIEAATANGSGIVTVTVEPAVKTTVFTSSATVQFERPVCIMTLEPGSLQEPDGPGPQPVSWRGIQKVY